jgi:NAD-dependent DNA ligase
VYYYKHGISLMPDHEYDALERSLKAINPTAPVLEEVGYDDVLDPHTEVEDLPD